MTGTKASRGTTLAINALFVGGEESQARRLGGLLRESLEYRFRIQHCARLEAAPEEAARFSADLVLLDPSSNGMVDKETFRSVVGKLPGVPLVIIDQGFERWFADELPSQSDPSENERFGALPLFHAVRTAAEQKRSRVRLEQVESKTKIPPSEDVTRIEGELRRSEERYRLLFDYAPIAMWETDYSAVADWLDSVRQKGVEDLLAHIESNPDEFRALQQPRAPRRVNLATLRLFEAQGEEEFFEKIPVLPQPDLARVGKEFLLALWEGRDHLRTEARAVTLGGRPIDIVLSIRIPAGDLSRTVLAVVDITDVKLAEEALQTANTFLEEGQRVAGLGIWEFDFATEKIRGSEEFLRMYGLEPGQGWVERNATRQAIHPDDHQVGDRAFRQTLETGSSEAEHRVVRPDGSIRYVQVRTRLERDSDGAPARAVGVSLDITERKVAERALWASEERYRLLFDEAPIALWESEYSGVADWLKRLRAEGVTDIGGYLDDHEDELLEVAGTIRQVAANQATVKLFGARSKQELLEQFPRLRQNRGLHVIKHLLKRMWDGHTTAQHESPARRFDGEEIELFATWSVPMVAGQQDFTKAIVSGTDVTARRVAERALEKNERLLRTITDNLPALISYVGRDLRYLFVNRGYEEVFGCPAEEIVGKHVRDLLGREYYRQYESVISRVLAGEETTSEGRLRTASGDERWVMVRYVPDYGADRKVVGFFTLVSDITERRQAEEESRRTKERNQRFVEASPAMIYSAKAFGDTNATFMSENIRTYLGYEPSEFTDTPRFWRDNIHPDDFDRVVKEHSRLFETEAESITHEYRVRHKDGSYRVMNDSLRLIRDEEGNPSEIVGFWVDVTEGRALEERFQQSQKMESVGRLAGGIAHDFNNLLTVIVGYVDLMRERFDERAAPELVGMEKAARRAVDLTSQLLAFSRRQRLRPVVLDLNAVIEEQTQILQRLIGEEVEFRTLLDSEIAPVKADGVQIVQVLMNLAVNARDAMPNGGILTVETYNMDLSGDEAADLGLDPGTYSCFSVGDTGTGMDPEIKAHMFEPFFTTKDQAAGTGLGLSTVHGIVRQSGGAVEVDSAPAERTRVRVYLAATTESVPARRNPDPLDPAGETPAQTILVVEDDEFVRRLSMEILRRRGYQVLEASNGAEAIEKFQAENGIDLVLTDIVMPGMRGTELAEQLKETRPGIRILFMSAYTDDRTGAAALGTDAPFIPKPFTPDSLIRKVREVLDTPSSRRGKGA